MQPTDLLMFALIAVMVFMMFRGSRKRKKQAEEMQAQLVPGAKVMLHSGIVGKVISVTDDHIVLESAGSKLEVVKMAVRTVSVWDAKEDDAEPVAEKAAPKIVATKTAAAKPAVKKPAAKTTAAKPAVKKPASKTTATKPAAKLEKN
ncbi:MAG: hypothetical protein RLZ69_662 [Actinomycetota bacterium]